MRTLLLVLTFAASSFAGATTHTITLGTDIDLPAGDTAVVSRSRTKSVVTCAALKPLPSPVTFEETVSLKYTDQNDASTSSFFWCAPHRIPEVDTEIATALEGAQKKCESLGYPKCTAPATDAYFFSPLGNTFGDYGCRVTATIVGSTN